MRMDIQLNKFDPGLIQGFPNITIIGKKNTGKSTLMEDLLYHFRNFNCAVVLSATEDSNEAWRKHVHRSFIHTSFKPRVISSIYEAQKERNQEYKRNLRRGIKTRLPSLALVVDDFAFDEKFKRDQTLHEIALNGRHHKIVFLQTAQYMKSILPVRRLNSDYVFVFRENSMVHRKALYEEFFGVFPSFEIFCKVMDEFTSNYECLVLDNTANKGNTIADTVYFYKAVPNRQFKLGQSLFRHCSSQIKG